MGAGIDDQLRPQIQIPHPPRRDHPDVRLQRIVGELEADLVVALAGGTVTDGIGTDRAGDLDLPLGDQRPGDRSAEQVHSLVKRVRPEHRKDVVADEVLAQVLDEDLLDPQHLRFGARQFQLLALADVGGEGDDLAAIGAFSQRRSTEVSKPPE